MENEDEPQRSGGSLVLFPGALGDAVCVEPAVAWLGARGPVRFAARGGAAEVAALFPSRPVVDSIDGIDVARLFSPLTQGVDESTRWLAGFDRVISFTGASSPELRARFAAVPQARVHAFPKPSGQGHAIDEMIGAVSEGAGGLGAVPRLELQPSRVRQEPLRLVLHPGAGGQRKRAPRELFREVAAGWRRRPGGQVRVLLGPAELEESHWWEAEVGGVVGPAGIEELARELAAGAAYVGNDSGPSHVAAALGVKGVVLFATTSPERFGARGCGVRWLSGGEGGAGSAGVVLTALDADLP